MSKGFGVHTHTYIEPGGRYHVATWPVSDDFDTNFLHQCKHSHYFTLHTYIDMAIYFPWSIWCHKASSTRRYLLAVLVAIQTVLWVNIYRATRTVIIIRYISLQTAGTCDRSCLWMSVYILYVWTLSALMLGCTGRGEAQSKCGLLSLHIVHSSLWLAWECGAHSESPRIHLHLHTLPQTMRRLLKPSTIYYKTPTHTGFTALTLFLSWKTLPHFSRKLATSACPFSAALKNGV